MRTTIKLILGIALLAMFACEKDKDTIDYGNGEITGYWVNPVGSDSIWSFDRSNKLKENEYGLSFGSEQVFVERKNAGFCGTPPITYADFEGTWSQYDSIINITVAFWGGEAHYQWKMLSVENGKLTVLKMQEVHNQDQ